MISYDIIERIINEKLSETNIFLVDLKVSPSNQIVVFIDTNEGIGIQECIEISKHIEGNLDREEDDFELQVSSPGMDLPFKVIQQYQKNLNREVKVYTEDGRKHQGFLTAVNEEELTITYDVKERIEGRKKRETVTKVETYYFNASDPSTKIKETKKVISFN